MRKNILTLGLALVAVVALVWWYQTKSENVQLPENPSGKESPILELVGRLKKIKIDTSFFDDQEFANLEPRPKPNFENLTKGKINPFIPAARR